MPNFHYYLTAVYGLKRREVAASVMVAMGFSNKQLGCLFNFSPQHISHMKTNLNVKLFNDSTSTMLRMNLINMIEGKHDPNNRTKA